MDQFEQLSGGTVAVFRSRSRNIGKKICRRTGRMRANFHFSTVFFFGDEPEHAESSIHRRRDSANRFRTSAARQYRGVYVSVFIDQVLGADGGRACECVLGHSHTSELLSQKNISWRSYNYYVMGLLKRVMDDPAFTKNLGGEKNFIDDVQAGSLPTVSWVFSNSHDEHPPNSVCSGENWTVEQINAVMNSRIGNRRSSF